MRVFRVSSMSFTNDRRRQIIYFYYIFFINKIKINTTKITNDYKEKFIYCKLFFYYYAKIVATHTRAAGIKINKLFIYSFILWSDETPMTFK